MVHHRARPGGVRYPEYRRVEDGLLLRTAFEPAREEPRHRLVGVARDLCREGLEVQAAEAGLYDVEVVLTRARDYGVVRLQLDQTVLDPQLDLFNTPEVVTTGVLTYRGVQLSQGAHRMTFEVVGSNPAAVKNHMVGVDYVRLVPAEPAQQK